MTEPQPLWADIKQASQLMGVADHVVRRACHRGQLPYKKFGRKIIIPRTALQPETANYEN